MYVNAVCAQVPVVEAAAGKANDSAAAGAAGKGEASAKAAEEVSSSALLRNLDGFDRAPGEIAVTRPA